MMEQDQQLDLLQRGAFGRQVEAFMRSDVGQYVLNRAADQIFDAQEAFKKADCNKITDVQAIQNKIAIAESVVGWLRDAVGDGIQAHNILDSGDE